MGGDYSVGLRLGRDSSNRYHVLDVVRAKLPPAEVEAVVKRTAETDGPSVIQYFEEEPGSAGRSWIDHYRRDVIPTSRVEGRRATGAKFVRAQPVAGQAFAGNLSLVRSPRVEAFLDELEAFSEDPRAYSRDDQVDALAGAYSVLAVARPSPPVDLLAGFAFGGARSGYGRFDVDGFAGLPSSFRR